MLSLKKIAIIASALIFSCAVSAYPAKASEPYQNYIYNNAGLPELEPQAYIPAGIITGESLGIRSFNAPRHVFADSQGQVYIADTGNNAVIILDSALRLKKILGEFVFDGKPDSLNAPEGVFVSDDGGIYVADTKNQRIVVFNREWEVTRIHGAPETGFIDENQRYEPIKLVVDGAGRMYIVSRNVNQGIIELSPEGSFSRFVGAIKVKLSANMFWRSIATAEQRQRMSLSTPTEYSSIALYQKDFIYGTISATGDKASIDTENFIRKINPVGNDILIRGDTPPMGDLDYITEDGISKTSRFVDICAGKNDVYSALDATYGRIFTYDHEGELLYIFGGLGQRYGELGAPVSLDMIGESYIVLDGKYNQALIFEPTEYGRLITGATKHYFDMEYEQAEQLWRESLKHTSKSDKAYTGIGKAYFRQGLYREAMRYFKLGNDTANYSKAYTEYRVEFIEQNYPLIGGLVLLPAAAVFALFRFKKLRGRKK